MFYQVFPLFLDKGRYAVLPVLYSDFLMNLAVRLLFAAFTMQGVVAVIALAVNVVALGFIIKRSIEQKKNPYKNEIFTDQKDFQLAMARAEGK